MEPVGYIILFHLDPPYKHAQHCFDWAPHAGQRIHNHFKRLTRGPRLINAAVESGSKLLVGRLTPGTKSSMLALRRGGNATRLCKLCQRGRELKWQEDHLEELLEKSLATLEKEHDGENSSTGRGRVGHGGSETID